MIIPVLSRIGLGRGGNMQGGGATEAVSRTTKRSVGSPVSLSGLGSRTRWPRPRSRADGPDRRCRRNRVDSRSKSRPAARPTSTRKRSKTARLDPRFRETSRPTNRAARPSSKFRCKKHSNGWSAPLHRWVGCSSGPRDEDHPIEQIPAKRLVHHANARRNPSLPWLLREPRHALHRRGTSSDHSRLGRRPRPKPSRRASEGTRWARQIRHDPEGPPPTQ